MKAKLLPLWCFESLSKLCECEPKSERWTKARSLFLSSNCENLDWLYQGHVWLGKNYTRDGLSNLFSYDGPEPNQPAYVKIRERKKEARFIQALSLLSLDSFIRLQSLVPLLSLPRNRKNYSTSVWSWLKSFALPWPLLSAAIPFDPVNLNSN